jgi:hypothetical protein
MQKAEALGVMVVAPCRLRVRMVVRGEGLRHVSAAESKESKGSKEGEECKPPAVVGSPSESPLPPLLKALGRLFWMLCFLSPPLPHQRHWE